MHAWTERKKMLFQGTKCMERKLKAGGIMNLGKLELESFFSPYFLHWCPSSYGA